MIAIGSGDPTKMICSALIAQAFDAVRYPILPKITRAGSRAARREILHIRDSSLYMPRDFDISPYFEIVKPTIVHGFDYTSLHWADKQKPLQEVAGEFGVFPEALDSPPLVPEEIDEEATLSLEEVIEVTEVDVIETAETTAVIERVTVEEHFLRIECVPARLPARPASAANRTWRFSFSRAASTFVIMASDSEAIQGASTGTIWMASSLSLLAREASTGPSGRSLPSIR